MTPSQRPPFRADQVGSLLRPPELQTARGRAKEGEISPEDLREIENQAIRDVVAMQEAAGLEGITDGEFRRGFWHVDFLTGLDGIRSTQSQYAVKFRGEHGETAETKSMLVVDGKIRRSKPVMLDHFQFLKSVTKHTPKFSIPSPAYLHMRGARHVISEAVYPDLEEFWADIIAAYRAQIADLAKAGCTYMQLDDVSFACLCDEKIREQIRADGEDPGKLPSKYIQVINEIIAGRPSGFFVTLHTCRGNHQSMWMAEGPYDAIAEAVFSSAQVNGLFLEFDRPERTGGFEPLRFVRKGMRVVLGLISSKVPQLESKDVLKRRIDEAAKYVSLDALCISPQCGFASSAPGNRLTQTQQRKKLDLAVEVAHEVWGGL
jgi:5-methyltetrahydropteroyltriglutamate--homocysteine methyltransferase